MSDTSTAGDRAAALAPKGAFLEIVNPATGERVGAFRAHEPDEVRALVARARAAQPAWAALRAEERATVIRRLRDVAIDRSREITETERRETGKAHLEASLQVLGAVEICNYYAKLGVELSRGRRISPGPLLFGRRAEVRHRPRGVAGVISTWNYPFVLALMQIAPALMAGNAVVHKPSEYTPAMGLLLAELCREAGVPEGVLQVVLGDGRVGRALIDAPVDVLSFTGSPETGRRVLEAAAPHLTPVLLELGGKDAAIVCDDADLERAANGITWGAFLNAGQTCIGVKRAIVHDAVHDRFVELLTERARALVPSAATAAPIGAITLPREIDRLERQVEASVRMGARLCAGGARLPGPGCFFAPTVLADCTPEMPAVAEETFGPLLAVLRARDDRHALALANASAFGLAGSVWSRDGARAQALVAGLEAGSVAINDALVQAMNPRLPFGGVKRSGHGRALGQQGYEHYCNVQAVMTAWLTPRSEPLWFPHTPALQRILGRAAWLFHGEIRGKIRGLFGS